MKDELIKYFFEAGWSFHQYRLVNDFSQRVQDRFLEKLREYETDRNVYDADFQEIIKELAVMLIFERVIGLEQTETLDTYGMSIFFLQGE